MPRVVVRLWSGESAARKARVADAARSPSR